MNKRLLELDALRGLAALFVVVFHFVMKKIENEHIETIFRYGVTGVDLFFIISGFVIFMSLNNVSSSKEFIINRVSRLYPTYWACVTFTFVLVILMQDDTFKNSCKLYIANMTMFQFYFKIRDLDGPYWTMIIEMLFYIVMLLIFQFKQIKNINLIGLFIMFGIVAYDVILEDQKYSLLKFLWNAFPLINYFPLFFAGIIFYKIYTNNIKAVPAYIYLIVTFIVQLMLFDNRGKVDKVLMFSEYAVNLLFYYIVFILFVNNKIYYIVNKATVFLGNISFALYLIHQYVSTKIIIPFLENLQLNFYLTMLITFFIVVLLAYIVTEYIESPLRKKVKLILNNNL